MSLHIPAIHHFPGAVPGNRVWGFHSLPELLEAANNHVFEMYGARISPPESLLDRFIHLTRECSHKGHFRNSIGPTTLVVINNGERETLSSIRLGDYGIDGLAQIYVPAGWGMDVLDAIDRGAVCISLVRRNRHPRDTMIEEVATNLDGDVVSLRKR